MEVQQIRKSKSKTPNQNPKMQRGATNQKTPKQKP
jgi:hypothetical protein